MLYTAKSHTGLVRQMNQDSFAVHVIGSWTLAVVADGMGGAAAGEIASQMATEVIVREVESQLTPGNDPTSALRDAIFKANQEIWKKSRSDVDYLGMGTTLVAALYDDETVVLGHVGDSRAYRFTNGQLEQITRDHSLVAELVRRGQITADEALSHPQRNVVTRSLGTSELSDPEIDTLTWTSGDMLLLCTDGLTNCVTSEELSLHLSTLSTLMKGADGGGAHERRAAEETGSPGSSLDVAQKEFDQAAEALVDLTLERGAPDNITLVLTLHRKESEAE